MFHTGNVERARIDKNGKVSIGTVGIVATGLLDINGTGTLLNITNSTNQILYASGTTGRIGIGTQIPTQKLEVLGAVNVTNSTGGLDSATLYIGKLKIISNSTGWCIGTC